MRQWMMHTIVYFNTMIILKNSTTEMISIRQPCNPCITIVVSDGYHPETVAWAVLTAIATVSGWHPSGITFVMAVMYSS